MTQTQHHSVDYCSSLPSCNISSVPPCTPYLTKLYHNCARRRSLFNISNPHVSTMIRPKPKSLSTGTASRTRGWSLHCGQVKTSSNQCASIVSKQHERRVSNSAFGRIIHLWRIWRSTESQFDWIGRKWPLKRLETRKCGGGSHANQQLQGNLGLVTAKVPCYGPLQWNRCLKKELCLPES